MAGLLRKANLLPFAPEYTIVPVLFLKNAPIDDARNSILPEYVVELMNRHGRYHGACPDGDGHIAYYQRNIVIYTGRYSTSSSLRISFV